MRGVKQAVNAIAKCIAPISLALVLIAAAPPKPVIGIIVDFGPREKPQGNSLYSIQRDGRPLAVRESEILYEGDTITFDDKADPKKTFVDVLVGGNEVVTLDPLHPSLPHHDWPALQAIWPRLVSAYRWVSSSLDNDTKLENAVSRGADDALTVLPNVRRPLIISEDGKTPLWLGWHGGKPPFTVAVTSGDKPEAHVVVCPTGNSEACSREATIPLGDGGRSFVLSVTSADGAIWKKQVVRQPIAWKAELADADKLGKLGPFLRATDLLDRGHGEYVLEGARELNSAATSYPPARTLLKRIREGQVP